MFCGCKRSTYLVSSINDIKNTVTYLGWHVKIFYGHEPIAFSAAHVYVNRG